MKSNITELKKLLKKRSRDAHKNDFGHVFILAGSLGLTGAAALCSNAVLRAGAGLATLGIPESLYPIIAVKLTEVMMLPLPETKDATLSLKAENKIMKKIGACDVVAIGPGLSQHFETAGLIQKILPKINKPMVLDADALNILAKNISILKKIKTQYVVTPHPGEMSRLIKCAPGHVRKNRLIVAKKFSHHYNACVVLKGAETVVVDKNNRYYINTTGNPGMATAGSGDVLTGVIAGFLSQGLEVFNAACLGVYIHGLAGDLAAREKGEVSLIASDILEKIPAAISKLYS